MHIIKLATVFSGIGSIEFAFKKLKIKNKIVFACDNGERELNVSVDALYKEFEHKNNDYRNRIVTELYSKTGKYNYVKDSYFANYNISEKKWYEDIRFIDGNEFKEKVDLFVGGSPCQSFSISGKRLGLEDARGTLFYEFARLVQEIKPKVFIYENVPGMLNHDNGQTFKIITSIFDELGYNWQYKKLVATDFDIPQNRTRLYIVGFRKDLNITNFDFPIGSRTNLTVNDFLEDREHDVDHKYFHGEKGFKWVTSEKSLKKRVSINSKIARTETANQQFNWCGDMIFYPLNQQKWALNDKNVFVGSYKGTRGVCRKLTPRECLRLMGYTDDFNIVVKDTVMYRQAGNSIVVNVMEAILKKIIETGVFGK